MRFLLFFCVLLLSLIGYSQQVTSVKRLESWIKITEDKDSSPEQRESAFLDIIHKSSGLPDSVHVNAYMQLSRDARTAEKFKIAIAYCDTVLRKFPKLSFVKKREIQEDRAVVYQEMGQVDKALAEFLRILGEYEDNKYIKESAKLNQRIGVIFKNDDQFDNAIYHLKESIQQSKKIKDADGEASALMTIGNCYKAKEEFDKAEDAYLASIRIAKKTNNQRTLAGNYNNMGSLMRMRGRLNEAMSYFQKAVVINTESKNDLWLSYNYNNIGNILKEQKRNEEAIAYFRKSVEIKERMKDERGKVQTLINISDTYAQMGDYKNAFENRRLYIDLNDSLNEIDRMAESQKLAAEFQSEKREAEIERLNIHSQLDHQKLEASNERIAYQNRLGWLIGVAAVLFLSVAIILWYSARNRKRINEELESKNVQIHSKNEQLDTQHKEIMASINYAKRIQSIILPSQTRMEECFSSFSMLFLPKDVVSGDFYLFEPVADGTYFGVVDCTGHGVPGAMMSLVGSSYFSKAIKEKKLKSPAAVLDFINKEFPKALSSNDVTITDGMDLGLCLISSDRTELKFAGANRNCWIMNTNEKWKDRTIRPERDVLVQEKGVTILELKGDRQAIGRSQTSKPFTDVSISMSAGDRVVLFTDGYVDQFGGEFNKKFRNNQLRGLLAKNIHVSAKEVEVLLKSTIEKWIGEEEQIDDICVMVVDF